MDDFTSSAHKLDVRGTLTTGAVFGIFLTIGQSWSIAIRSVSLEVFGLRQGSDGTALSDVIAGGVVTAVSLVLLFAIVWGNRCFEKTHTTEPNPQTPPNTQHTMDLTCRTHDRFRLFPLQHPQLWDMYKKAEASFWTAEEIDLATDKANWKTLPKEEREFLSTVLGFFATADQIVNENLARRFADEVTLPEARSFYGFQIAMENIHAETYNLLIETLIQDNEEKRRLFNGLDTVPSIKKKAEWALKWLDSDRPFGERLVAFACVEGIFFSASFCAIFWIKKRGTSLPGVCFSNELISRDEGMHCDFACQLFHMMGEKAPSEEVVKDIVRDAVECEMEFVRSALQVNLIGMNAEMMCAYVKFVADVLLSRGLCLSKMYDVENPFDWMELISLQGKTNFFEKRVGEYQKANVVGGRMDQEFTVDEDF